MDKYKVKSNSRAIRELDHIYKYIANEKLAPENAKGQIKRAGAIPPALLSSEFLSGKHDPLIIEHPGEHPGKQAREHHIHQHGESHL